jgi:4-amino-4-deoxy-L-arabinose transferase-like glycosyltransferase
VLATSVEYFYLGKAAVTDITLTFCLTVALLSFLQKNYYLAYAFAGLAVLAKGPVGILFPGAILFLYVLVTRQFKLLLKIKLPTGMLLFFLIALPWYIVMYQIHGNVFLDTFIGFHNITRFTSPEHPETVFWYYYIPVLLIGFFPWTAILFQSVWNSLKNARDNEYNSLLFLNIWAFFIFLFFSVSQTKLVSYILPMYPPMAIIAGWYISRVVDKSASIRLLSWPVLFTVLASLFIFGMFSGLKAMPELKIGVYLEAVVLAAMVVFAWFYYRRRSFLRLFGAQVFGMIIFVMLLVGMLFPVVAPHFTSREISQVFLQRYDQQSPIYVIKFLRPGFAFYSGHYGIAALPDDDLNYKVENAEKAYFVIRWADYLHLSQERRASLAVLWEQNGMMLLLKQ